MTNTTDRKTAQSAIECAINIHNPTNPLDLHNNLHLTFANGRTIIVQVGALSAGVLTQALLHGLKQKLVDAAAISRDPETGRTASIETKFAAVREVADRLQAGEWNKRRADGTGTGTGGLLYRALVRMYAGSKTPEAIREFLASKTDAEQAALRKNARVAAFIAEIRAESAKDADGIDSDDLLAGLGE